MRLATALLGLLLVAAPAHSLAEAVEDDGALLSLSGGAGRAEPARRRRGGRYRRQLAEGGREREADRGRVRCYDSCSSPAFMLTPRSQVLRALVW
jgi:hypothetical protein